MPKKSERDPNSPEDEATVARFHRAFETRGRAPFMSPPPVPAIDDTADAAEEAAWWSKRQPQDEHGLLT